MSYKSKAQTDETQTLYLLLGKTFLNIPPSPIIR